MSFGNKERGCWYYRLKGSICFLVCVYVLEFDKGMYLGVRYGGKKKYVILFEVGRKIRYLKLVYVFCGF